MDATHELISEEPSRWDKINVPKVSKTETITHEKWRKKEEK